MPNLDQNISERTEGTKRTISDNVPTNASPDKPIEGITTSDDLQEPSDFKLEIISFNDVQPEILNEPEIKLPGYMVYDDWFSIGGQSKPPGLYWHGFTNGQDPKPIDTWVSSLFMQTQLQRMSVMSRLAYYCDLFNPLGDGVNGQCLCIF